MAVGAFSTRAKSDAPERVLSTTGAAVLPWRRSLKSRTVINLMTMKSWIQSGVVEFSKALFTSVILTTDRVEIGRTSYYTN